MTTSIKRFYWLFTLCFAALAFLGADGKNAGCNKPKPEEVVEPNEPVDECGADFSKKSISLDELSGTWSARDGEGTRFVFSDNGDFERRGPDGARGGSFTLNGYVIELTYSDDGFVDQLGSLEINCKNQLEEWVDTPDGEGYLVYYLK